MSRAIVSIAKAASKDEPAILAAVRSAIEQACDFASLLRPGATVLIKPNVFAPLPAPATTDPRVVAAVVKLCRQAGAERIIVGEGRSISTARYRLGQNSTRACFQASGIAQALADSNAELLPLEEDDFCEVALPEGEILRTARVPLTVLEADVILNLPVLKMHGLTLATLAIKNLHGLVCDEDKLFSHSYRQKRLARKLVDIIGVRRPDLNLVDGLSGMERDQSPPAGRPVEMGIVIAGRDIVAVDAVGSAAMGLRPMAVDTTRIAHRRGLGEGRLEEIEIRGEPLGEIARPFAKPEIRISEERFPGLRLIAGNYCRACEYYVCRGLEALAAEGLLSPTRPLALVMGRNPPTPARLEGRAILVGDCCLQSGSVKPLRNHLQLKGQLAFLWACPPMQFRLRGADLLGGRDSQNPRREEKNTSHEKPFCKD